VNIGKRYDSWADALEKWWPHWPDDDLNRLRLVFDELKPRQTLELGIGDGRLAQHLRPSYGVDVSREALTRCSRRVHDSTRLLEASFATFSLSEEVDFAYCAIDTLNHVIDEAELRLSLSNIWRHLTKGGLLYVDSFVPDLDRLRREHGVSKLMHVDSDVAIWFVKHLQSGERFFKLHGIIDTLSGTRCVGRTYLPPLPLAIRTPEAWRSYFTAAGFSIASVHGGYDRQELGPSSTRQIWLLRKGAQQGSGVVAGSVRRTV
jgi:SAM-dependent methyltransferase